MPAVPVLMVLYSNDAVEVRYSDGSCIQVAPCGSTFVHHESPKETFHPAHGLKAINQRSQFVTSVYKDKVIQALDFRNRFAERPYICQELIPEDQIVPLYARIQEVAWPKDINEARYEFLSDGGVKLISEDEFASLVLSPHRSDFTVCFLCRISKEFKKGNISHKQRHPKHLKGQNPVSECRKSPKNNVEGFQQQQIPGDAREKNLVLRERDIEGKSDHSSPESPEIHRHLQSDLSISPISVASSQRSQHSSPSGEKEENGEYYRYSTPTLGERRPQDLEKKVSKTKSEKHKEDGDDLDGSYLEFERKNTSDGKISNSSGDKSGSRSHNTSSTSNTIIKSGENSAEGNLVNSSKHSSLYSCSDESRSFPNEDDSVEGSTRCFYSWVTKHFSCDECPVAWSHPINMARTLLHNKEIFIKKALKTSVHCNKHMTSAHLHKILKETCHMSQVPRPLYLTCPGQHLHKQHSKYVYDDGQSPVDNAAIIKQGRLKVLLVEGVVYRIVRLASTKNIEIFPGDGSVFVSEGLSGHFFRHLIPHPQSNNLEEKTYSLKALPPTPPNATYSIEKLLKRAHRFILQVNQEDKILTSDLCCWKHEDNRVVEPLMTSLLEECTVPGYGRFTAFSNGHVRVVFDDRTSLDMMCDFTKRVEGCIEHSHNSDQIKQRSDVSHQHKHQHLMNKHDTHARQGLCKLLLTNGQYQMVDINQPGVYRRYTDAALEWADWVNSSPKERTNFYKLREMEPSNADMAAKEIQKIKCFNYIIDNTSQIPNSGAPSVDSHGELTSDKGHNSASSNYSNNNNPFIESGILGSHCTIDRQVAGHSSRQQVEGQRSWSSVNNQRSYHPVGQGSFAHASRNESNSGYSSVSYSRNEPYQGPLWNFPGNKETNLEMLRGFNSVREALLKTSQAIHDIDDILEKR